MNKITQSFIKTFREYRAGEECGLLVKHQYVDGNLVDRQSEEMAKGSYFEFLLSGGLPKNGIPPQAEYMQTALNKAVQDRKVSDMTVDYRRAHWNAGVVRNYLENDLGLKFLYVGKRLTKGRFEGTLDLICECTKDITFEDGTQWKIVDPIAIDLKYTGLLDNRWSKHGWMWSDIQKEYHGTQAIQYHYISELPFYFLAVGNSNNEIPKFKGGGFEPPKIKFVHIPVDQDMIDKHISEANYFAKELALDEEMGFIARPDLNRCGACPIRLSCDRKHTFPHPKKIDIRL